MRKCSVWKRVLRWCSSISTGECVWLLSTRLGWIFIKKKWFKYFFPSMCLNFDGIQGCTPCMNLDEKSGIGNKYEMKQRIYKFQFLNKCSTNKTSCNGIKILPSFVLIKPVWFPCSFDQTMVINRNESKIKLKLVLYIFLPRINQKHNSAPSSCRRSHLNIKDSTFPNSKLSENFYCIWCRIYRIWSVDKWNWQKLISAKIKASVDLDPSASLSALYLLCRL